MKIKRWDWTTALKYELLLLVINGSVKCERKMRWCLKMSVLGENGKSSHLKSFPWASGNMVILTGADRKKEPKVCLEPYYGYPAL